MSHNLFKTLAMILFLTFSFFFTSSVDNHVHAQKTKAVVKENKKVVLKEEIPEKNVPKETFKKKSEDAPKITPKAKPVEGPKDTRNNNPKPATLPDENLIIQPKKVYLTFDDGPDRNSTMQILNILDHYQVKGVFFVVGTHIEKNRDLLLEIDSRGHYVGNHTYSHNYKKIYESDLSFIEDIQQNEELIYSIIGKRPRVIRDPGGKLLGRYDSSLHRTLVELGYYRMEWTIDSFDSRSPRPSKEKIIFNVFEQLKKQQQKSEVNILFHDTKTHFTTIEALPEIIEHLLKVGYEISIPEN